MDDNVMVSVKNVSMEFNMSSERIDSIKEYFIKLVQGKLFFKSFWALNDVSVDIRRGEVFGIIGLNGSGKSTLLKVISGIMKPTKGTAQVFGTLSPMIELGAGFDPELSGGENIYLNGAILGYSRKFMRSVYDEIVDFAEIGDFIDTPVKNYSSGMKARIGFAIATVVKPQVLIVDEVLGVGDFKFQKKCEERISELMAGDTTVIFVSHSLEQVRRLCTRVMWLKKGSVVAIGDTRTVCDEYEKE
ncbi:MAG: ABC transporter ATP-binding protein [Oscillospiraceae bacterium]|nr:ABC transporter ATP-binding protein [Oscillospiraceae bacterium]